MSPNESFAEWINGVRDLYIANAVEAAETACAGHHPGWCALDVANERLRAGERWNREHPEYARLEEAA